MRTALTFFLILITYGLLILGVSLLMPLRLGEILQAAAFLNFSWDSFFGWIAQSPNGAPLHYLVQLPTVLLNLNSRLLLRIPSVASALIGAVMFFALAKRVPLRHPLLALALFLLIPTHLAYATQARPYEFGLMLMLLATLLFFSLLDDPGVVRALVYALVLTACLYTQPSCFLPAVGYLVSLLAFANLKNYRRALWFVLIATAIPVAAYAPYALWAGALRREWLMEQFPAYAINLPGLQALMSLDPGGWNPWFGLTLVAILVFGLIGGVWSAMPLATFPMGAPEPPAPVVRKRAAVFCLAGGAIVPFLLLVGVSGWNGQAFAPFQVLWSIPGMIIALCAGLDALNNLQALKNLSLIGAAVCVLAILLCIPGDVEYLQTKPADLAELTAKVRPQLTGDACLVFVSERLSSYIFEVFDPSLGKYECQNFFHKRVVLLIHPFVRPDQERDARIFFRGLDFDETHRDILGNGKVITMDATR